MYDLIIRGASVIDGTGADAYISDVAIKNGKIAAIGAGLSGAGQYIDAAGLVLCPGFVDSHSHCDQSVLTEQDQKDLTQQGITFAVTGQCGGSVAPSARPGCCETVADFVNRLQGVPLGANLGLLVGHGTMRFRVAGLENRAVTDQELAQMVSLLEESMKSGAMGMSLGLTYAPGSYADTRELTELAKVVARYNGIIDAHIRNESDQLLESVEEFITVLKNAGCKGVISHHKAADRANWGMVQKSLAMVDDAAKEGVEVYADAYPYCASMTGMASRFVPPSFHPEGTTNAIALLDDPAFCKKIKAWATEKWGTDLSWVLVTSCAGCPEYIGRNMNQIAEMMGIDDGYEAVFALLRKCGRAVRACFTMMCQEDVKYVLAHPRVMIGTDSDAGSPNQRYHPRRTGTFPRILGRYVREQKITTLPEMIRKMTWLPAQVYDLTGKGRIAEGFDADLCIFDPDTIRDTADYVNCSAPNEGLRYVLIAGKIVVENNTYNGTKAGKVFRRR